MFYWKRRPDVIARLNEFRSRWAGTDADFERRLHRYLLACCRMIWDILPQEGSRQGIAVAERYHDGLVSLKELRRADYHAEGAAFQIDYSPDSEDVVQMVELVGSMPRRRIERMVPEIATYDEIDPRELLLNAAYFAAFAVGYPDMRRKVISGEYHVFLSSELLENVFNEIRDGP